MASNLTAQQKINLHGGSKIIVSCHLNIEDASKEDLWHLVARVEATSPDIIRLVIEATDIIEMSIIFHLLSCSQVQVLCYEKLTCFFFLLVFYKCRCAMYYILDDVNVY